MRSLIFLSALLLSIKVYAASCCGGGFAFPALILGDDKALFTSSFSYGSVTDDVLPNGKWIHRADNNQSETMKIDGAYLISDLWQTGMSVPVVSRQIDKEDSMGLGDISINLGYEFLPELSYSEWKPKGLAFLQITLPTSPSVYDATNILAADSRGRGFFTLGPGMVFTKNWKAWDAN
ncbi:MAG TPA: hypothetical protein VN132_11065, partial [Bdellovibrio sp.]|nr:hypothetical protein [Bdellovibrio sp.]